jgi:hypothetical protein
MLDVMHRQLSISDIVMNIRSSSSWVIAQHLVHCGALHDVVVER